MKQCTCYALRAIDCTCKPAKYGELYTSRTAKQEQCEPVAMQMDVIVVNLVREGINKHRARELAEHFIKTTTPQQRTWVGLTDEEFEQLLIDAKFTRSDLLMIGACVEDICNMVEAKLKEKNT